MPVTVVVRSSASKAGARRGDAGPEAAPLSLIFDIACVVIGRGEGCELRLPDESVSSRHASIRQKGTAHVIEDEGSTNGTYLAGQRLAPHASRPLADLRPGRDQCRNRPDRCPDGFNPYYLLFGAGANPSDWQ